MKLKNKLSLLLTISPIMISPLFLAASCGNKVDETELKKYKDKLEKLQKDFDNFTAYVEKSSVTNAQEFSNDKQIKDIQEKLKNKLEKLSKIDNSFHKEIEKSIKSVIKKFKDSLLNDLFNLNVENNAKFWSTFNDLMENNLDSETNAEINSLYSIIKNLNYDELSEVKFDNSDEDNGILEEIEEKISTWNKLKSLVNKKASAKIKEKLDSYLSSDFANEILKNKSNKMLQAFSKEYKKIKESSSNINTKELVAQKFLLDVFLRRLENLYDLSKKDIANIDKTIKERFTSLLSDLRNKFDVFNQEAKEKLEKLISDFEKDSQNASIDDLNKFMQNYLDLLEKETYKWMLSSIDDIISNDSTEHGQIFKELSENVEKSNNSWMKKYLENIKQNIASLQTNKDNVNWYFAMEEVSKLTSLIENWEYPKKSAELKKVLDIYEKNKVYDFELEDEIAKLKLKIKETYEEAKKIHESPFSSIDKITNATKKLNDILNNEVIHEQLRIAGFKKLLSEVKERLNKKVDTAFDDFGAKLKEKSTDPEKISEALKTLVEAQKELYKALLESFEDPFIKIKLPEKDYPDAIRTLETLSLLLNEITIEVINEALKNKDSSSENLNFLTEVLTKEFISRMLKKITNFISNQGDILLKVIETIFTRLREVKELKDISILEGVIQESIKFYKDYVQGKGEYEGKGLMKKIAELNIPSLTLSDPNKLELELAPLVLEFRNMWGAHWRLLEQKFPGKGDELSRIGKEWNSISGEMFNTMKNLFARAVPLATAHMRFFNEIIKYLK